MFAANHAWTKHASTDARALFSETVSQLNHTGGLAAFDSPNAESLWALGPPTLSPEEIDKILDVVVENLSIVIELDQSIKEAHYYLGVAYIKKEERNEAMAALYRAMEVEPDREMTYTLLIVLLSDAGKFKDALAVASKYSEHFPRSTASSATMAGHVFLKMGDFDKALKNGIAILEIDNSSSEGRILVAASYYCLGNKKAADEQFKALENDPIIKDNIADFKQGLKDRCGEAK